MNLVVKLVDPLDQKPELKFINRMFQSLDLFTAVLDSNIVFHRHFVVMQCQLIRSQPRQLSQKVYITVAYI